ncbi:redoxin, partial [Pelomonas sp. HMWF004]
MLTRRTLAPALALLCAAALSGCARERAPEVGYVLLDGQKASSQQWAGKVMLVNFWATSCATCVAEMPRIIATHNKFKARGYDTLAVAMSY